MTIASKDNDLEQLDSISKRLKNIIDTLGVKQSHMAEKLGLSPSGLHYILNNDVKFSKNAKKIVDYLNTTELLIAKPATDFQTTEINTTIHKVPLHYPDELKLYYHKPTKERLKSRDFIITTTDYANKAIGIHVTDASFSPKFEIGDHLIFEHVDAFKDGEIILAYLVATNSIVIRYGFYANMDITLVSLDSAPIKLPLTRHQVVIIGAYRECLKKAKLL